MAAWARVAGLVFALWMLAWAIPRALAAEARMESDRDVVEQGEGFILNLVLRGVQASGQLNNLPVPGVTLRYLGAVNQMESINGQTTVQVLHRYLATPEGTNDIVVPGFNIQVGNQTLSTRELRIRVVPREQHAEPVWTKLLVDRQSAVVGESFPVEVQLYFRSAREVSNPRLAMDGFVLGRASDPRQAATVRDGEQWSVLSWRFAVTASKAGDLRIGPAEIDLTLLTEATRRGGNVFDDFFGPPRNAKRMTVKGPTHALKVTPPPASGRPQGFAGVIGRYGISASVSPPRVNVGDPATVRVTIEGEGGIEQVELPPWPDTPNLRVYPGTNGFAPSDALGLSGTRTVEYVVVPERSGKLRLPVPALVSYDPASRQYRTASAGDVVLDVMDGPGREEAGQGAGKATGVAGTGTNAARAAESPGTAWRVRDGTRHGGQRRWGGAAWIGWVAAAPWMGWAAWAGSRAFMRRRAQRPAPPARDAWRARMERARKFVEAGAMDVGTCGECVRCWLGWYLDREPGTVTSDLVGRELRGRGFDEETLAELDRWFEKWENRKYSPEGTEGDEELMGATRQVVRRLEEAAQGLEGGR
jgi:hypothetical protein